MIHILCKKKIFFLYKKKKILFLYKKKIFFLYKNKIFFFLYKKKIFFLHNIWIMKIKNCFYKKYPQEIMCSFRIESSWNDRKSFKLWQISFLTKLYVSVNMILLYDQNRYSV